MAKEISFTEGRAVAVLETAGAENRSGIAGDRSYELIGEFYKLDNETVYEGQNDSTIVLGRDRFGAPGDGYGGTGATRASAIDIVVGRVSSNFSIKNKESLESGVWLNPDFENDCARIYISQKSDVDDYFDLPEGVHGKAFANSSIGMKADNVRIMSRQAIKLVSSMSRVDSSNLNIVGGGIELIALDPSTPFEEIKRDIQKEKLIMQPIPKGDNLVKAFEEMLEMLDVITGILSHYVYLQNLMNSYLAGHTHIETFNGNPGIESLDIPPYLFDMNKKTLDEIQLKIENFKSVYLNDFKKKFTSEGQGSNTYINSKYHFLN